MSKRRWRATACNRWPNKQSFTHCPQRYQKQWRTNSPALDCRIQTTPATWIVSYRHSSSLTPLYGAFMTSAWSWKPRRLKLARTLSSGIRYSGADAKAVRQDGIDMHWQNTNKHTDIWDILQASSGISNFKLTIAEESNKMWPRHTETIRFVFDKLGGRVKAWSLPPRLSNTKRIVSNCLGHILARKRRHFGVLLT